MESDKVSENGDGGRMRISSDELNYLVYRYLQESGLVHAAFCLAHESQLFGGAQRAHWQKVADKTLPPGALVSFLQKGLQYLGIEESLASNDAATDFSILSSVSIQALTRQQPPIQLSLTPAATAAAVKARLAAAPPLPSGPLKRPPENTKKRNKKQKIQKSTSTNSVPSASSFSSLQQAKAVLDAKHRPKNGTATNGHDHENDDDTSPQEMQVDLPVQQPDHQQPAAPSTLPDTTTTAETSSTLDSKTSSSISPPPEVPAEHIILLQKHLSEVFMCAWNPVYTNLIATGSADASARIWEMQGPNARDGLKSCRELPHGNGGADKTNKDVTTLEWSTDGQRLATGSYSGIARVWDQHGKLVNTLQGHEGPIFSLKWNKRGNFLLSGSYDKTIIVWDLSQPTHRIHRRFRAHQDPVLDVDWKDDTTFASCSSDKTVHVYSVNQDAPLREFVGHEDEVNAVKWSSDGRYLASCSDDSTAKVWDIESDSSNPLYDFVDHEQEIYTVKWSPPGAPTPLLATASFDGAIRLWNIRDGSSHGNFKLHKDSVYSVAFSPSGEYLASGSLAGQLYVWHVPTHRCLQSYKGKGDIFEVAWNQEGTRIAACFSSNAVAVIDFKKEKKKNKAKSSKSKKEARSKDVNKKESKVVPSESNSLPSEAKVNKESTTKPTVEEVPAVSATAMAPIVGAISTKSDDGSGAKEELKPANETLPVREPEPAPSEEPAKTTLPESIPTVPAPAAPLISPPAPAADVKSPVETAPSDVKPMETTAATTSVPVPAAPAPNVESADEPMETEVTAAAVVPNEEQSKPMDVEPASTNSTPAIVPPPSATPPSETPPPNPASAPPAASSMPVPAPEPVVPTDMAPVVAAPIPPPVAPVVPIVGPSEGAPAVLATAQAAEAPTAMTTDMDVEMMDDEPKEAAV